MPTETELQTEIKQLRAEVNQLKEMVMSLMQRVIPEVNDDYDDEPPMTMQPGLIQIPTNVEPFN